MKRDALTRYKLVAQLLCTQFSAMYELKESRLILTEMEQDLSDLKKDIAIFAKLSHTLISDMSRDYVSDNELENNLQAALKFVQNCLNRVSSCLRIAKNNTLNQQDSANIRIKFSYLLDYVKSLKDTETELKAALA